MSNLGRYVLYANGVSLVIHPVNPFVPTVHANFRFMRVKEKETDQLVDEWFGGGCDLTPNYLFEEDAILFHKCIRDAMVQSDEKGEQLYQRFKVACDLYFHNKHRKEVRYIFYFYLSHVASVGSSMMILVWITRSSRGWPSRSWWLRLHWSRTNRSYNDARISRTTMNTSDGGSTEEVGT